MKLSPNAVRYSIVLCLAAVAAFLSPSPGTSPNPAVGTAQTGGTRSSGSATWTSLTRSPTFGFESRSKIGGSPGAITALMGSEIAFVLATALTLAALLTWLASRYGAEAARAVVGL